jgi:hypothetical protein
VCYGAAKQISRWIKSPGRSGFIYTGWALSSQSAFTGLYLREVCALMALNNRDDEGGPEYGN